MSEKPALTALSTCIAILVALLVFLGLYGGWWIAGLVGLFILVCIGIAVLAGDGPDFGES